MSDIDNQIDVVAEDKSKLVIKRLDGSDAVFTLETFPVYKTKRVLKIVSGVKDKVDLITLVGEILTLTQDADTDDERANKALVAFDAIPKLMDFAPDVLLEFAALAIISRKELSEAYDNNTIEDLVKANKKMFDLDFDASILIKVFSAYIPYVGINFLIQEMKNLNDSVVSLNPKSTG